MIESPDQQLKKRIIEAVRKEGILDENKLQELDQDYLTKGIDKEKWIQLVSVD